MRLYYLVVPHFSMTNRTWFKKLPAEYKARFEAVAKKRTGDVLHGAGAREVEFALAEYLRIWEDEKL